MSDIDKDNDVLQLKGGKKVSNTDEKKKSTGRPRSWDHWTNVFNKWSSYTVRVVMV
jgi:hypothetical protein